MNKNTLTQVQTQACVTVLERYKAGDEKINAAKAGRTIFMNAFMDGRRAAMSRFGMRVLLAEAGLLECDISETATKMVDYLVGLKNSFELVETGFNSMLARAWNYKPFMDQRLTAFSVKIDDQWVGFDDAKDVMREVQAMSFDEWASKGFWESLRWLIANHPGAEVINNSEFFKADTLSAMFRVRGNLSWWASFQPTAQKGFTFHEENLHKSEEEYRLSGGCNTHYVGEAQEKWEAAAKRLEKATEAMELMANADVQDFIDALCIIFELAGREEPRADEFSEEVDREKQLATMEDAMAKALQDLELMVDAAIKNGRIAA